jgi:hypothetical protein
MTKLSKFVFTLSDKKELILSNHDALELYNELHKIFGGKLSIGEKSTAITGSVGIGPIGGGGGVQSPWYPNDNSYVKFEGDTITLPNSINEHSYNWDSASPTKNLHNVKGVDGVYGATAEDTITITSPYADDYSWASAPPAKQYCKCKKG